MSAIDAGFAFKIFFLSSLLVPVLWEGLSLLDWAFHHFRAIRTTKDFWVIFYIWPWTTGEAINIRKRKDTMEWSCNFYNLLLECETSPAEKAGVRKSGISPHCRMNTGTKTRPGTCTEQPHDALRPFGTDKHFSLSAITYFLFRIKILLQKQLPSPCWLSLH